MGRRTLRSRCQVGVVVLFPSSRDLGVTLPDWGVSTDTPGVVRRPDTQVVPQASRPTPASSVPSAPLPCLPGTLSLSAPSSSGDQWGTRLETTRND